MTVFTYYDELSYIDPKGERELIQLWRESWERNGWNTRVLGPEDARKGGSSTFDLIAASKELNRGYLPPGYSAACHHRWLALKYSMGGFMVDYDVINLDFFPGDLVEAQRYHNGKKPLMLMPPCPCAVLAMRDHCKQMIRLIVNEHLNPKKTGELATVCHDQAIFSENMSHFNGCDPKLVADYDEDRSKWEGFKLVHFRNNSTPKPRAELIRKLLFHS